MSLEGKSPEEIAALAELSDSLLGNSATRTPFQRLLKTANPRINLPELEVEDRVTAAVKPTVDAVQKLNDERDRDAADRAAHGVYEELKDERVVGTKKEFSELVAYANDKGFRTDNAGLRRAAEYRSAEASMAEPTPMPGAIPALTGEKTKEWFKDPKGTAAREAHAALEEIRKGKLRLPQPLAQGR